MHRFTLTALIWSLLTSSALALSLEDAFKSALATNSDIAAQEERLDAFRAGVRVAQSARRPQVALSTGASWLDREDLAQRRGGSEVLETWRASVTLSQLIYDGFRASNSVRQAGSELQRAEVELIGFRQALLLDVVTAYADVRRARVGLAGQERLVENLTTQRVFVERNLRGGMMTRTDLAQANSRLEAARAAVSRARAQLIAAEQEFSRLVGVPPGTLSEVNLITAIPQTAGEAVQTALEMNSSVQAARLALRSANFALRAAKAERSPRVALEAGASLENGFDFPSVDRISENTIGVRISMPLYDGGAIDGQASQQRAILRVRQQELRSREREVVQRVNVAYAELSASTEALSAARKQLEAAELAAGGVRREQMAGFRSAIDVLDQEQELLNATNAVAIAERDVSIAQYRVLVEIGLLECKACSAAAE